MEEKETKKATNEVAEKTKEQENKKENSTVKVVEKEPEKATEKETKKTEKNAEETVDFTRSVFDGGLLQLIGWKILGAIVTIFTLGICYPYALCFVYRWQMKHTTINGKRLEFDGKGHQLLGNWIKWLLLSIVTLGIYTFWIPVQKNKWIIKHTHYKDEKVSEENNKSEFDGTTLQYIGYILLAVFITVCSFGILFPFALCLMYNWRIKHTIIDGDRMEFDGRAVQLFGLWIKWILLSIITIGIYSFWIPISLIKWETKHTNKDGLSKSPFSAKKSLVVPVLISALVFIAFIGSRILYFSMISDLKINRGSNSDNNKNIIDTNQSNLQANTAGAVELKYMKNFSDGVAWVEDDNENIYLIDAEGKVLYETKSERVSIGSDTSNTIGNFESGYAKITDDEGERIINKSGETVLEPEENKEIEYLGGGLAKVEITEENYLEKTTKTGVIDLDTNKYVVELSEDYTSFKYLQEGMLLVGQRVPDKYYSTDILINTETGETVSDTATNRYIGDIGEYNNGYALLRTSESLYLIDKNGNEKSLNLDFSTDGVYSDGLIYAREAFYDENGNKVIDLEDQNITNTPVFINGHALLIFNNGSHNYYTIMDKQGEFLFEPKEFRYTTNLNSNDTVAIYGNQSGFTKGGYLLIGEDNKWKIIDTEGETKLEFETYEVPRSGLSDDGMIIIHNTRENRNYYVNVDGDKIDSLEVDETEDKKSEEIKTGTYEYTGDIWLDPENYGITSIKFENNNEFSIELPLGTSYTGKYSIDGKKIICKATKEENVEGGGSDSKSANITFTFEKTSDDKNIKFTNVTDSGLELTKGETYSLK